MHVHVLGQQGEAKFWLEPAIELAANHGLPSHELATAVKLIEEHQDEFRHAWNRHFGS